MVECNLPKVEVAGSIPVSRFFPPFQLALETNSFVPVSILILSPILQ